VRRRSRLQGTDATHSLLDSLSLDELWAALASLSAEPVRRPKTIEAAHEAILGCGSDARKIEWALRSVEAQSPKTHCYFGTVKSATYELIGWLGISNGPHELSFAHRSESTLFLTFERTIQLEEWDLSPDGMTKHKVYRQLRAATIVLIDEDRRRLVLTYTGFSGGDLNAYSENVNGVLAFLAQIGVEIEPLPIRACVTALVEAKSQRLVVVRADTFAQRGRVAMTSTDRQDPVEKVLAQIFGDSPMKYRRAIEQQLRDSAVNHVLLLWKEEQILTRIEFWPTGADVYVIWGKADRTFATLSRVTDVMFDWAGSVQEQGFDDVWTAVQNTPADGIIMPTEFTSRFAAKADVVRRVLIGAVEARLLVPVFRLRADESFLEEVGSAAWTTDLATLNRQFGNEDGLTVNGTDPNNILVAFRRQVSE
jgi:hypothetical protein